MLFYGAGDEELFFAPASTSFDVLIGKGGSLSIATIAILLLGQCVHTNFRLFNTSFGFLGVTTVWPFFFCVTALGLADVIDDASGDDDHHRFHLFAKATFANWAYFSLLFVLIICLMVLPEMVHVGWKLSNKGRTL